MRQIVLDTETTGLDAKSGHRIIEIGCVEMINRKLTGNHFHYYINPEREIDAGAQEVHGISLEFLQDKPKFKEIVKAFIDYVEGAELIIHNASFDIGFLNAELRILKHKIKDVNKICTVTDSLLLAREKHPGQRNSLDALCKRYEVDNFNRELHGALLDSEILAEVYLRMTGGQTSLGLLSDMPDNGEYDEPGQSTRLDFAKRKPRVFPATADELKDHQELLSLIDKKSDNNCLWLKNKLDLAKIES